jgi:hypothetical protein
MLYDRHFLVRLGVDLPIIQHPWRESRPRPWRRRCRTPAASARRLGESAAQLGTAFIACPESQADSGYRTALSSEAAHHTVMTRAISAVKLSAARS